MIADGVPALRLPVAFVEAMIDHARTAAPVEACGLIAGEGTRATRLYPVRNVDDSPYSYTMDPQVLYEALREIDDCGQDLVAIYHSHPTTPAYPSPTDIALAFYPDSLYVIISLCTTPATLRAFRIADGRVAEVAVRSE